MITQLNPEITFRQSQLRDHHRPPLQTNGEIDRRTESQTSSCGNKSRSV